MSYKYDFLVFIGRFQPFHIGHKSVIDKALTLSKKVIVLLGSSGKPRSPKNPWTVDERIDMIRMSCSDTDRIVTLPLYDKTYNDSAWVSQVQSLVEQTTQQSGFTGNSARIGIIGYVKDESSYYLKMFPQWELVEHSMNEIVNATDVRSLLFEGKYINYFIGIVPDPVLKFIDKFTLSPEYQYLKQEYRFVQEYRKSWEAAPYPPIFVTTDAVVVQSGHILLIQRKSAPGQGLWALPGGFLNQNERIVDGIIRELREETKLKVPKPVLRGSIVNREVFDDPNRSNRGRTITHAALIELPPGPLPKVTGSDDAKYAKWVPLTDITESNMFEDHYAIISYMLGI